MASMGVGLRSVKINGSSRLNVTGRITVAQRSGLVVRAQQSEAAPETTRRSVIGLVAAGLAGGSFVQAVLADAVPIKIGPPPPPSGGLPKESAKEIVNVKSLIDKKAWPYVQNDLCLRAIVTKL
ncbi:unnamed protein product [Brassica napus]|uniref:(rape) hypothetical protein n=1 Tax=Brassica napus TaxID=3708 RepID=A0A816RC71_BRANA|nr:unnamed protein product [Brassica napus]